MADKKIEELQAENEALKAELETLKATQTDGLPRVTETVTLKLEDPETGKEKSLTFGIKPGIPNIRYRNRRIVPTAALMKLAAGKKLNEEQAAAVDGLTKDDALNYLTEMATIGAGWLEQR